MSLIEWVDLPCFSEERGSVVIMEGARSIPFPIKRIYYLLHVPEDAVRGCHAHRSLQQVVVAMSGKCRLRLDNGRRQEDVWLDSPQRGLFIGPMVWREMHDFSRDCVLLAVASDYYKPEDYIVSHDEFLKCLT